MAPAALTNLRLGVRRLPPNIFAMVMATGIVSPAANTDGWRALAHGLFWLNLLLYAVLWVLLAIRCGSHADAVWADLHDHARATGFFTIVAATCILGKLFLVLAASEGIGLGLSVFALVAWVARTYSVLPWLMEGEPKPPVEKGLNGGWLIAVVGTQGVCVLGCTVVGMLPEGLGPFVPLCFWLVGGRLYLWLIALSFYRILFLPLPPGELTPPYWINTGAMAISTLAGAELVGLADQSPLVASLLPFVKGMMLLFWATATWWIPVLLALGAWRHLWQRYPLAYDYGYWAAVFPLGMYTACTQQLIHKLELPFLEVIPAVFLWIALAAWVVTFVSLLVQTYRRAVESAPAQAATAREGRP